jgi:hypothetical protein
MKGTFKWVRKRKQIAKSPGEIRGYSRYEPAGAPSGAVKISCQGKIIKDRKAQLEQINRAYREDIGRI